MTAAPRGLKIWQRGRDAAMRKVRYWVFGHDVIGWDDPRQRVHLGEPSYSRFKVVEGALGTALPVTVGRYSGIHATVSILVGSEHDPGFVSVLGGHMQDGKWVRSEEGITSRGPVTVGNDAWVGYDACILSGVTIGDGAVVGARALVRKDVEPFSIVGGNPARHIRFRFEEPVREALLRIKWWDWTDEKVAAHAHQIHSAEVEAFVAAHDPSLGPPSCELCR